MDKVAKCMAKDLKCSTKPVKDFLEIMLKDKAILINNGLLEITGGKARMEHNK
jgi:hypothetical protein